MIGKRIERREGPIGHRAGRVGLLRIARCKWIDLFPGFLMAEQAAALITPLMHNFLMSVMGRTGRTIAVMHRVTIFYPYFLKWNSAGNANVRDLSKSSQEVFARRSL